MIMLAPRRVADRPCRSVRGRGGCPPVSPPPSLAGRRPGSLRGDNKSPLRDRYLIMRGRRPKRGARAAYAASVVIVVAMVLTGCAHSDPHAPRTVAPTDPSDCNALTPIGDGGVLAGFDWSSGDHPIGEAAVVYACFQPQGGTLVITSDSAQVTVTSSRVAIPLRGQFSGGVDTQPWPPKFGLSPMSW